MNGQISIEGLKIDCVIGVHSHERLAPQTIIVDVDLMVEVSAACRDDAITSTVDYEAIVNTVKAVATEGQFQLVETLADACAEAILEGYPANEVFVRIRKPQVVAGTDSVGVSVVRRRQKVIGQTLPQPSVDASAIEGKVIGVTGATDEFGCAVARHLAERGAHVVLLADDNDRLGETAERIRRETQLDRCSCIECDVRSSASVEKAFAEIESRHARLDAFVNLASYQAGVGREMSAQPTSELVADAEQVLSVDLLGTLRAVFAAEQIMRRQNSGVIITIGTDSVLDRSPNHLVDQIASAGIRQLTQSLAAQHGAHSNIRLYWLALDAVFTAAAYDSLSPARRLATTIDGWLDPLEHIAPVIAALISGQLARETGSTIRLDSTTVDRLLAEIGDCRVEFKFDKGGES